MCECLRGIFRVTWTPSSNADSDREDSHEHPEARGSPVNNKRRSPPSDRPHHGTHHSLSADEQDSPERIVQKEKLHEELKQVLSQKRSQFYSAPQSSLAEMEEATKTYSKQEQEEEDTQLKDLVEVVVETQAEVGASGYSVVGGGERGIFIQEVLKDSPAAKHLSLQKGDQLLSARVYFDNVKYEDALKILQCAEPYKVSFFLKRTVQGAEINIRPGAQTLELKGPKAKIQRMSVKSVKPFKTKKMRGGRFGLKRLKENKKARAMAELDTEGATGSPVDVEFVLPKFKMRKSGKVPVDESVELQEGISRIKKKKNIRFLKMKATGLAEGEENLGVDALTHKGEVEPSETKLKVKAKGSKFGIHFPKTKKSKLDAQSSSDSPEREPLQSSVELNSPEMKLDANVENEHALDAHVTMPKIKLPKLRLSCHSDEIDGNFIEKPDTPEFKLKKTEIDVKAAEIQDCNVKGTKIKAKYDTQLNLDTKFKLKDDVDGAIVKKQISLPVTDFTISHGEFSDTKVNWPEIDVSLPQMRLTPCKGEEPESKGEGREHLKGNIEFGDSTTGEIHIDKQKVKGKKPKMPTFDEHLPKVDGTEIKTGKIYLPEIDISLPKEKESHSVEIASKGDKLHFPQIELSLPKRRSHVDVVVNTEGQIEDEATMIKENIPSIDISFQKGKTEGKSGLHGGSSEFEMSSSKMKSEGEINIKPPDIRAGKIQIEKPDVDASMAKLKHSSAEIDVEFPNLRGFNMPPIDISLPGGKSSRMEDYEAQTGQGKKSEKPKCDASLPKGGEIEVHGASSKGGKFHIPTVDISLPRGKAGEIDHQKKTRKGKKIELPTLEVPKPKSSASGINVEGPKIKGGDIHTPHVDITIPEEAKEHSGQPNLDIHVSKAQPGGEIHIDSPDVKMGKICTPTIEISSSSEKAKKTKGVKGKKIEMPKFNVSTPKIKLAGDEMDNQGLEIKGPQIVMSTIDVSKPGFPKSDKVKSSGKEIHIESPVIKGGKMHIPSIEISLPAGKAGDVDVDAKSGKGRKFEMPKFNVSPPKIKTPKGKIDVEGPEGGKFHMPTVDISLPGGTGADAGKGKTFEIPTVDVSLPKIKSPEGDVDIDVHGIESERIHIPSVDISLPEGGKGEKLELEAPSGKANTFKIPTVDVSLPKVKSPGIEINTEGLEVKGGKMHMPSIEISLPAGKAGDVEVDAKSGKGRKFEMPKLNVSPSKIKTPKGKIDVEGPEGGKFHVPTVDISLPGGTGADAGPVGKGKTFEIPTVDISMPNIKSPEGEVDIDVHGIKSGGIHIPSVDISLPEGEKGQKIDIEGPSRKGNKFKMPKVDVSLPKMRLSGSEFDTEGSGIKGEKMQMPSIDIALPAGKNDVETQPEKEKKVKIPKFDVSLPTMNPPEGKIEVEGLEFKGSKFHMPTIDISLPGGTGADAGPAAKGKTFEIPTVDVSLPKIKSPESEVDIDVHGIESGKIHMPSVDISLPGGGKGGKLDIEGPSGKGNKFKMPKLDVSLPKIRLSGSEFDTEDPKIKGEKIQMPSIEISLPAGKAGDVEAESQPEKGRKFEMPKFDVSLPKIKSLDDEIHVENPDFKGGKFHRPTLDISLPGGGTERETGTGKSFEIPKINVSIPNFRSSDYKIDTDIQNIEGKFHMPTVDISLPEGEKEKIDVKGPSGKGNTFKMPKLDVSLPKMRLSGSEFDTEGPEIKGGKMHKPSIEISLPVGNDDVNVEAKTGKGRKFEMPKVDASLPKIKSSEGEIDIDVHGIKSGKVKMPSVDISLPEGGKGEKVTIEGPSRKGNKFKMPKVDVSLPKMRLSGSEFDTEGPEIKGGKMNKPSIEISLPVGKADEIAVEDQPGKGKKVKIPKFEVSPPKTNSLEGKIEIEGPDFKGPKFHMPTIDISLPGGTGADAGPAAKGKTFEIPTVDVSLPKIKSPEGEIDTNIHKITGGKIHIPSVDISLPGGGKAEKLELEAPSGKANTFKIPTVDVSLPKVKSSGTEIQTEGLEVKGGKMQMPSIEISLPAGKAGDVDVDAKSGKGRKFEMPKFNVSPHKIKTPKGKIDVEGPEGGKFHVPTVDISLPGGTGADAGPVGKGKIFEIPTVDVSFPKIKSPGGEVDIDVHGIESGRIHIPSVDISLPEGGKGEKHNIEGPSGKGNLFKMPKVDVSLPKMRLSGSEVNIEGHEIKGGKFHVPTIDISLPKGKSGGDMNIDGHTNKGRTFKMPQFDIPLPKFKSEDKVDVEDAHLHMPSINVSLPEGEIGDDTGRVGKGNKFEMPKIGISLPKINSGIDVKGGIDYESAEIKGGRFHMPTVDITVPRGGIKGVVEPAGKGTKVDVTMPKVSSGEMNVKDPTFAKSGTIGMPAIEISIPKGKAGTNLPNKDERFNLPSTDISLTKEEITIEGNMKSGEQPKIDISQPGCKINATAPEMKAGQFNLPSVEISPPKVKLQDSELKVERLDKKEKKFQMPDIDISIPKISHSYDAGAKTPSLNTAEVTAGGNIKLPTMKIPTVDISAPKVDLEFTLPKGKGSDTEDIELLKAEGGRPSSGSSIDVPDVSVKMPKVSLPKFGAKWKGVEKETEVPGLSKDLESSSEETYSKNKKLKVKLPSVEASKDGTYSSDAEIELKGSGEITKPEFKTDSADSKLKPKVKLPKFISFTKSKLKDVELDITPMSMEKGKVKMPGVEIALPKSQIPECEILLPKSEVDVSEADIKGYEGNLKIPKMPSLPTVTLDEFNSSDRGKVIVPNVKIPKVDLSIPHGKTRDGAELETDSKEGKFKMPKMAIPTVDISLPKGQSTQKYDPELEGAQLNITLQTEKAGALDTAKQPNKGTEIKSGKLTTGNIQFPSVETSIPHGKVNETGPYVEISAKGKKFKMPDVTVPFGGKGDASLPKLKTKKSASPLTPHGEGPEDSINDSKKTVVDISLPHLETVFSEEDRHFQMPEMKMPKIDISFSQAGAAERSELNVDTEKTKMTKVVTTSTIDQHRTTGESVSAQGVQFKISDFKMVKTDVSLTEERTREFHTTKIQVEGETGKHIKPTTSSKTSKQDTSVTLEHPNISASLKESHEEGKTNKECPKVIPEQELMPTKVGKKNKKKEALAEVDLSSDLPKKGTKGPKMKGTKFNIGMPKVKLSEESKAVKEEIHISKGDVDPKLTAFHKKVDPPKIPELDFDIEPVQIEIDTPEDDPKLTGKVKIPKFGIPLPSLTSAEARSLTPDAKYKDPSIPKVKKAVFVMVNPQAESSAGAVSPTSTEAEEERLKLPKIKMKPSFSKSHEKEKAIHYDEAENEGKLKSGKVKMPKVTFSSGKTESLEASPSMSEDGASLNSEKDEKATIGKLKLPRVEFFSPYTKDTREEETKSKEDSPQSKEPKKTKSDTMAFSGLKKKTGKNQNLEETGVLVSSKARTEMLAERDRSESPATPPGYVSETKWEREETTWFKVPKVTLSPHSTGILVITPEGSPKERKSTLPGSGEEASGGFYVKMPSIDFSTHEMSTEHRITTKEESRTVMTKVTKYTESKMSSSKQDAKEL